MTVLVISTSLLVDGLIEFIIQIIRLILGKRKTVRRVFLSFCRIIFTSSESYYPIFPRRCQALIVINCNILPVLLYSSSARKNPLKSMTCARGQCWAVPHMARTAQTPYIRRRLWGTAQTPPICRRRSDLPLYRLFLPAVLKGSSLTVSVSPLSQRGYHMSL